MIAVATKHPNVYIDTSAYTVQRYPAALVDYLRGHGRHKVLFGTNWPMIPPARRSRAWRSCSSAPRLPQAFSAPMRGGSSACKDYFSWPRISPRR